MVVQSSSKQSETASLKNLLESLSPEQIKQLISMASPSELKMLESEWQNSIRTSLADWAIEALSPTGYRPARHHRLMIERLEAVGRGEIHRLMIMLPPGSGKSTFVSMLFPAWWFAQHPRSAIIACSNTAELADKFGRKVRDTVNEHSDTLGYTLNADNRAAGRWETSAGGEYFAAGINGTITGRRGDLILIDDPIASREDADSEGARNKMWSWYHSDLLGRMKPGGRVIIVSTRWHDDDLCGRLLATQPDGWNVLCLPAVAREDDPLGRAPGEYLWDDDAYGYGKWLRARHEECEISGAMREWSSPYQQDPHPLEGSLFKVDNIKIIDGLPDVRGIRPVRAWDLAASRKIGSRDPDWTAGLKLYRMPDNRLIVADVVRIRGTPEEVEKLIMRTANADGWTCRISLPQDPGQAGLQQVEYLTRQLIGFQVDSSRETGDKTTRASPVSSQVNVGNLSIVKSEAWNRAFIEELRGFPAGAHDDMVDGLSRAFAVLGGGGANLQMWAALGRADNWLPLCQHGTSVAELSGSEWISRFGQQNAARRDTPEPVASPADTTEAGAPPDPQLPAAAPRVVYNGHEKGPDGLTIFGTA